MQLRNMDYYNNYLRPDKKMIWLLAQVITHGRSSK